jgi:NAD(P)-dependent dehydrogenase (short-subunit alcohol dehydrogenase family)
MNPFLLENKTILITGASSGIGRQCAINCSKSGATVLLLGRSEQRLTETLEQMSNKDIHGLISIDLNELDQLEPLIMEAINKVGKIDGLINCAGISTTLPLNMAKPGKIDEYFKTNVQASINLTRIASKNTVFSENGGSIIFISSVMGMVGEVGKLIYSLTKGALIAGSKSLALELAPRKIRVNCISPGVVITPMSQKSVYNRSEESLEKINSMHPLGLGKPDDVANACIYLLSDASRWITGTNLVIDGGYTAR